MSNSLETNVVLTDSMIKDYMEPGFIPDISHIQDTAQGNVPYLEILEEPKQRGFRFRYPCEGPSHGGLPGERSERSKKSYPSVQIVGYTGQARIAVSLVSAEHPYLPHAHSLVGKFCKDGVCTVQVGPNTGMTASFQNLGIEHVTKKNVTKVLMERYIEVQRLQTATINALVNGDVRPGTSSFDLLVDDAAVVHSAEFDKSMAAAVAEEEASKIRKLAEEQTKSMNLSIIRLCFQAYLPDNQGSFTRALNPVLSKQVYDSKAPASSQLKICRMDKNAGSAAGHEEVFLLCDKVQKEDIEVRFYEEDYNGALQWEDFAIFSPTDVHRQYAIVFKTPAYKDTAIQMPVKVFLELRRKNGNDRSDPCNFTYTPIKFDNEQIGAKRRKTIPHFQDYYGGSGGSGMGGAGAGDGGGSGAFMGLPFDFLSGLSFGSSGFSGGTQQGVGETENKPALEEQPDSENAHELLKSAIQKQAMYAMLALNLAVRSSNAMRMFAATGDVRYMLAVQQHLTAVQDEDGDSALHLAIINCQSHVVESILAVMVDLPKSYISQYNYLRQTPLHLAVLTRQAQVVKKLIDTGADALLPDRHGNLPVHIACSNKDVACLLALLKRTVTVQPSEAKFIELNTLNYDGLSPVHLAVKSGSKDVVRVLHDHEADVNVQESKFGKTPLHIAVETKNLVLTGYLILDAKCDVDAIDRDGNTALHVASGLGLKDLTALLVAAGANTEAENAIEEKPLDLAYKPEVQNILSCDDEPEFQKVMHNRSPQVALSPPSDFKKTVAEASTDVESGFESYSAEKIPAESEGDMERVDHYLRYKMSQLLDASCKDNMDWKLLTKKLQLGSMAKAFAIQPSPTTELFNNYEACGGTVKRLREALSEMKREDVLEFLKEVPDSTSESEHVQTTSSSDQKSLAPCPRLDSGLGSMEKKSGESFPSLPQQATQLDEQALLQFRYGRTDVH